MTELEQLIRNSIARNGPMPFETYMAWCLFHPLHGYYVTRDPLGAKGDFITAPEISQFFGEIIALWAIDAWVKLGKPKKFVLLECGPGRGTLMHDLLRAAKVMPDFLNAAYIVLLEKSPALQARQKQKLKDHKVSWLQDAANAPELPTIMICNEFFDAFPVQRFVKAGDEWQPQNVTVENGQLAFTPHNGTCKETSPLTQNWMESFAAHLNRYRGAALIIDYGYEDQTEADTLQAVKNHHYISSLETPGECDITAHVDFTALRIAAEAGGLTAAPLQTQRDFLLGLGLQTRLEQLQKNATPEQQLTLQQGAARLVNADEMGTLFKVLNVFSN